MNLLAAYNRGSDFVGLMNGPLVIDTDGRIERVDTMKSAYNGAADTGFNIFDHPLDAASADSEIMSRMLGLAGLAAACRRCPVSAICGGGNYSHRFKEGTGFHNPSVYCSDLFELIKRTANYLRKLLTHQAVRETV